MEKEVVFILPKEHALVNKNSYRESSDTVKLNSAIAVNNNYEMYREPLGIESIAAYLRVNNYKVKLFFCELEHITDEEIVKYVQEHQVKLTGFSVLFDRHLEHALRLSKKMKELDTSLFFGGPLASFAAKEILNRADWLSGIFIGEGEKTVYEVTEAILHNKDWHELRGICYLDTQKQVVFTKRQQKVDIDAIPNPSRDFFERAIELGYDIKVASIYTSRGCAQACTFCTGNQFTKFNTGKIWRGRSPEVIVSEVEDLVKRFGVNYFYICDDNFFGYGEGAIDRVFKITQLVKEKNLNVKFHFEMRVDMVTDELLIACGESGFVDILLGIESGVQSMLNRWKKDITVEQIMRAIEKVRSHSLNLRAGFILFDEVASLEEVKENLEFIKKAGLDTPEFIFDLFNPMQVFIGSTMQKSGDYKISAKDGTLDPIVRDVINVVYYDYEIKDKRVWTFWEMVKNTIDEANYYFNYYVIPYIMQNKKKLDKRKVSKFLKRFNQMHQDIGDIMMDVCLYAIESVDINKDMDALKEKVKTHYNEIERNYFIKGIYGELQEIMMS